MLFASLFSGFGLADIGAKMAGCELAWGVELDPAIAEVSKQLEHQVLVRSVIDTDFSKLERPDILWASPPCPNFSIAKANAQETELDRALAIAVVDAITTLQPQYFILENVEGYKRSKSLEFIEQALYSLGYWVDRQVLNAADFGVPQTRKRLILRAVKGGFVPSLPRPVKWKGWYEAIEDLIPGLPETKLADWQVKRLPPGLLDSFLCSGGPNSNGQDVSVREASEPALCYTKSSDRQALRAVLVESRNTNQQYGDGLRWSDEPATSVLTGARAQPRAVLIESKNANQQFGDGLRFDVEPATTVITDHKPSHQPKALMFNRSQTERDDYFRESDRPSYTVCAGGSVGRVRAMLETAQVVQMTARCLARFQTLPNWYELPDKATLACKGIGNGVPCELAEAIVRSLVEGGY